MRRYAAAPLLALAAFALGACSQNEQGRKTIEAQCIAGGGAEDVCACLATTSAEKLDKELFDIVVLGAQGEDVETAERIEELSPELENKMTMAIPEIIKSCGAESYLVPGS
jgi:Ni,Fe-hydrogenase maturation factor